jgi:hypothetical protein
MITKHDKFKSIFEGLKIAYGQYQKGERAENGKQKGKAFIVRKNVSDDLWHNHLKGEGPALGIIPITENNSCRWGCIDIDQYDFDHTSFIQNVRKVNLPLIVCRSKSGGAHVFLFTKDFIPAATMQTTLKKMAATLGYEGSEIFPKQVEKKKVEEAFLNGPPCLNRLAIDGFGEGARNNALFNIAVYYKQATPDGWENNVVQANMRYMNPPLSNGEVQQLIKSVNRKGYDKYRCKDAPINSVCNSGLCRMKKFGVGFGEEEMPILGNLTKYASKPPQWFLNVGDSRIELKTEQLYNAGLFALACLDQANLIVPVPKPKDWKNVFLKTLIDNGMQEVEPLESLDPINQITSLLQDWTTNRQNARTMEDVFNKLPYTDENRQFTYFRMEDFYNFCKKNNWEMDKIKTGNLIKQLDSFQEETRPTLKAGTPRLIKIKTFKKNETTVSKIEYQENNF